MFIISYHNILNEELIKKLKHLLIPNQMRYNSSYVFNHSFRKSINKLYGILMMRNPKRWKRMVDNNIHRSVDIKWRRWYGVKFPFENPQTLNEKIQYLLADTDISMWSKCADKYEVREYVKQCGLGEILTECYGVWDRIEDIDWNKLPNQFVIKCTHDCGSTIIVDNKSQLDIEKTKAFLSSHMKNDFCYPTGEVHYAKIVPRIMAEELIPQESEGFQSRSMADYKFWGFRGRVDYCMMVYDRGEDGNDYILDLYSVKDWKQKKDGLTNEYDARFKQSIPRPENLDRMIEIAQVLSKQFPQVRVDLYNVRGRIYFGELTFTSQGGKMNYYTEEFQRELGSYVIID